MVCVDPSRDPNPSKAKMISASKRMASVQQPIIPVIGDLILANPGTISLGQGIVHYPPPTEVESALHDFWSDPTAHQYGPVEGLAHLRSALAGKLEQENAYGLRVGRSL